MVMVAVAQKMKLTGDIMANSLGCAQGDHKARAQQRPSAFTARTFQESVPHGLKFLSNEHGSNLQKMSLLL